MARRRKTKIPTIRAAELHRISSADALALVDTHFGQHTEWPSDLISYRLSADFQADWKEEVGHWLHSATAHGFLRPLLDVVLARAKRGSASVGVDPNDKRHLNLMQELTPAMVVHYLVGTGWRFSRWDPDPKGGWGIGDVDLEMESPDGHIVNFQVKAPDQPGVHSHGRILDGEYDDRVRTAVIKGAGQLYSRTRGGPAFVVVSPQRTRPLATDPAFLVPYLYGRSMNHVDRPGVWVCASKLGWFFTPWWNHVSGVIVLGCLRAVEAFSYPCTVLLNPNATHPGSADWFPRARVVVLEGDTFRWIRGPTGIEHSLPDGTMIDWAC